MSGIFDKTSLFLSTIAVILTFLAYQKTGELPWGSVGRAGSLILDIFPKLMIGMLIGALMAEVLPKEIIQNWLSDRSGWRGILIGWVAGFMFPMGAPFVLYPIVAGLLKGGAGFGPMVTLLTASALIGPVRTFVFEIPVLGTEFFMFRAISIFWIPPVAGLLSQMVVRVLRGG